MGDIHAGCSLVVMMIRVYYDQFDSIALLLHPSKSCIVDAIISCLCTF